MPNASTTPKRIRNVRLRVRAEALADDGAGVALLPDGRRVLVAGLLPGEEADVQPAHRSPHTGVIWATIERRHDAAPERVVPVCPGYGRCGGCVMQHLDYPAQLRWKQERLQRALTGAGAAPEGPVAACVAGEPLRYRNRAKLVAALISPPEQGPPHPVPSAPTSPPAGRSGRVILGAYAPRSHRVIDMAGCRLVTRSLDEVGRAVAALATRLQLVPFNPETGAGTLRYVLLREVAGGEVQVSLVFGALPEGAARAELLDSIAHRLRELPQVASAVVHLNRQPGDVLLPPPGDDPEGGDLLLFGEPALWDRIGPVSLRVSPRSFLQINRPVAERLYADVCAGLAPAAGDVIADLYCGIGGIGLTLLSAAPAASLIGIEENPAAVLDAQASAARAGTSPERARFLAGDVAAGLAGLTAVSLAVLNPPRRGCAKEVLAGLAALSPRALAYVSCDPDTLARDLGILQRSGYRVIRVTPYDMHPHTPHVEALALLRRGGDRPD